jgi:phage gp29-like protein
MAKNRPRQKMYKEVATPSVTGVRTVWHNPVTSTLTPQNLATIFSEIDENGDNTQYLTLAEEMEERDPHYFSVLGTRKMAVAGLPVSVEAVSDQSEDMKIADFVRDVLTDEATIRPMLYDLLDSLGKGYAACEIIWDRNSPTWVPDKYIWRDPRFFQFDRATGSVLSIRDDSNYMDGIKIPPNKFLVHAPRLKSGIMVRGGLARMAAVAYMCKGYSLKDWMAFVEVYGMPLRLGKYDQGASPEAKTELLRAVANLGTDAAAIIPKSMEIMFEDGARSGGGIGEAVFERLANWLNNQVSKAVLGQTMTTEDGSSLSQAEVHDKVRGDILVSDAEQLSATLARDLVKPLVDLNFGPRKKGEYPIVKLVVEEPEDLESLAKSLPPFINLGLPVEASVILDKFGLEMPDEGSLLLGDVSLNPEEPQPAVDALPEGEPTPQPEEEEPLPEPEPAAARKLIDADAHRALLQKVIAGETLTDDQRHLLSMLREGDDEIDRFVNAELAQWRGLMNPILDPIVTLAEESETYEEFLDKLEAVEDEIDVNPLAKSLATLALQARALGDKKDKL